MVFVHKLEILKFNLNLAIYIRIAVRKSYRMRSNDVTGASRDTAGLTQRWDETGLWPLLLKGPGPRGFDRKAPTVLCNL